MNYTFELPSFCRLQRDVYNGLNNHKFVALKGGRRGMKTFTQIAYMCVKLLEGNKILYALPAPEGLYSVYKETLEFLSDVILMVRSHDTRFTIEIGKGRIDFKTLKKRAVGRGFNYNIVIIDEAQECEECSVDLKEVIEQSILPTFLITNGQLVLSGTGRSRCYFTEVFNKWETDVTAFTKRWSSYENPYVNPEAIQRLITEMDEVAVRQEIYAEDIDRGNTLFRQENLKYIEYEDLPKNLQIVVGVDLAISMKDNADYTAIVAMGKEEGKDIYYILDVVQKHLTFNATLETIKNVCSIWNCQTVVIESVQYQASMVQELTRNSDLSVLKAFPETDKFRRAIGFNAKIENGKVYISKSIDQSYTRELLSFPLGKHDDMVDATVYAYRILRKYE